MYWKRKNNSFSQAYPQSIIRYEMFCEIKKYCHVFDNIVFSSVSQSNGIATKPDELIEHFNKKF